MPNEADVLGLTLGVESGDWGVVGDLLGEEHEVRVTAPGDGEGRGLGHWGGWYCRGG